MEIIIYKYTHTHVKRYRDRGYSISIRYKDRYFMKYIQKNTYIEIMYKEIMPERKGIRQMGQNSNHR